LIFNIFWYYALYLIIKQAVFIVYYFYRHYIRGSHDLLSRYGDKSWVLVTGATDGIGKGFAMSFAKLGFNIVLVSRTQSKLDEVAEEIKKETDYKVEVKTIAFDFTAKYLPKDYHEAFDFVKSLDLSVLINNVGWAKTIKFDKLEGKQVTDHINLNVVPQGFLTTMFLRQLSERSGKKSAIINLSSFGSTVQGVGFITYCAAKTFNNSHSKILSYEMGHCIDTLSVKPMYVTTPLTNYNKGANAITVDQLTNNVLPQLGNDIETFGHPKHEFHANLVYCVPNFLLRLSGTNKNVTY